MNVFRRIFHEKYISKVLAAFEIWWGQAYVVDVICLYDLQVVKITVKTWWGLARQPVPMSPYVQASRRSCDITLSDFSCFSGQNSAHILEEFGVHLLFLKRMKKLKAEPST